MFETPFTKNHVGPRCCLVEDQWKRRTILTSKKIAFNFYKNVPTDDDFKKL